MTKKEIAKATKEEILARLEVLDTQCDEIRAEVVLLMAAALEYC